jgi:hypothetical protein
MCQWRIGGLGAGAVLVLLGALAATQPAAARPMHRVALADCYGKFLPAALNNCGTCHVAAAPLKPPASLADFPHNPFGNRLRQVGEELRAAGKRADIPSRLRAVAKEDSDGDGVPNEVEILTGHRPGDPKDKPSRAELATAGRLVARFRAYERAYRWQPFEPVQRPPVPEVRNRAWVRNPIDAFIAAEHQKRGLKPRPEASKPVLLRRVYLDLTGLSPTPEELHAFLADRSADAYEKVVERLLASPAYGERWGRHWMDVWRYSDWAGYGMQVRDSKPHIWRWRDWIVQSLNQDRGYDRMVTEMLAGDEVAPTDPDALRATGYLVRNYKLLSREKWMQDVVDHTGQAFLGLTVGCARCHDHMYDPIAQKEYYRLRAIFEPHDVRTDWVPGQLDPNKDGLARAYDANPAVPTYLFVRGDDRQPVTEEPLAPGVPESLGGPLDVRPVSLPLLARVPKKQPFFIADLRADMARRVTEAREALQKASEADLPLARLKLGAEEGAQAAIEAVLKVEQLEDQGKKETDEWRQAALETTRLQREAAVATLTLARAEAAAALRRAEGTSPPKTAEVKAAREKLGDAEAELAKAETQRSLPPTTAYRPRVETVYPATSTGRRLALARWLTSPENPLTARVAVNQIWMRHFGQGIVPTVDNFGHNGQPPTHPQLLDWLAAFMMEGETERGRDGARERRSGWRMKPLHRLIVTSRAYRMASTPDPEDLKRDPDNRWLWRMNSRRMDAEIVRDNVLYSAGRLDLTMGGPDIDQNLGMTVRRRTLYFRHAAEKEMPFLAIFDGPNVTECYRRKETVVPQQALALANSELALTQARFLARSLSGRMDEPKSGGAEARAGGDPSAFVTAAFERVLARAPTPAERAECRRFLDEQTKRFVGQAVTVPAKSPAVATTTDLADASKPSADPALRAREDLVLVLFNHNDFVTIR